MANRAAGKGYENEDNYSNIKFQFIGIENIHVMRSSLQKMLEVCELKSPSMSDFLWGLENSGWLRHIKAIMDAGIFIAKVWVSAALPANSDFRPERPFPPHLLRRPHSKLWPAQWGAGFADHHVWPLNT